MFNLAVVIGSRPDVIRSSIILRKLRNHSDINLDLVWSGQHYDANLKDSFFKELNVGKPDTELDATGSPCEQHWKLIKQLSEHFEINRPDACVFLGDTNAVIGCIVPLKMGIPIVHIEAGMRSHDNRMPEERNRILIDRVSDVLYAYHHDYKCKLVQEGICPTKIVVTGNTIVDVLMEHLADITDSMDYILKEFKVKAKQYGIMTMHRDEHMKDPYMSGRILTEINEWAYDNEVPIILPLMPRLRKLMEHKKFEAALNGPLENIIFTEPLGFFDFIALEGSALIEFTDSGTNQEMSALLETPCVVIRKSTERPETFDSGITVMTEDNIYKAADYVIQQKFNLNFSLGGGNAADIIVDDLVDRLKNNFYKTEAIWNGNCQDLAWVFLFDFFSTLITISTIARRCLFFIKRPCIM